MKTKLLTLLSLTTITLTLIGCDNATKETENTKPAPVGELQTLFKELTNNNFSLSYDDYYANNGVERHQDTYYTPYSLQSDGDLGFNGYAQKGDLIFSYNIVDDQIVSSSPLINQETGVRYESVYDLRNGFEDFDYTKLPTTPSNDGLYHYEFNVEGNTNNDRLINEVLLRKTYNSDPLVQPESLTFEIVNNTIQVESLLTVYGENIYDAVSVTIYGINSTNNAKIKSYLDSGKGAKDPLDRTFYTTIAPYLANNNFKTHLDATKYRDSAQSGYSDVVFDQYFTEEAIVYDNISGANAGSTYGQMQTGYGVAQFSLDSINDDKLEITSTPMDEEMNAIQSLYGNYFAYPMSSLNFSSFIGYKDDTKENTYILTDSYLKYVLSYICFFETDTETRYCDRLELEITDLEKHEFNLNFHIIDRTTNYDKGIFKASFSNVNEISFKAVDRYLNIGEDPTTQNKEVLETVLEKFKAGNYSMDTMTGYGHAKVYYTDDYYYVEPYSQYYKNQNYGYIKIDNHIYEFNLTYPENSTDPSGINIDRSIDHATGTNPMTLPGCGTYQGASNDLFYVSHKTDDIYNYDNYQIATALDTVNYWRNTSDSFGTNMLNYFYPNDSSLRALGSGFIVSDGKDPYDTRVSLVVSFITSSLQESAIRSTFYDIGHTSFEYLENYISQNI